MEQTPNALRKHIAIVGRINAGKSTLFNTLTGQRRAIVSDAPGTTTDPVSAAMELHPYGPVILTDTAGTGDETALGAERMQKTSAAARRADAVIFVLDATAPDRTAYEAFAKENRDHILVFTKIDLADENTLARLRRYYPGALFLSGHSPMNELRARLAALLSRQKPEDAPILGDLMPAGSTVLLVTPIDSAAPKGRLILPQIQVLRDCLDHGMQCVVCRETELENALSNMKKIDIVVADSQVFGYVNERLPEDIRLTSFSILLARQKGNFSQLLRGAKALENLQDGDRILMLEGCTHNSTHEDIGRVKIPALTQKKLGCSLTFDFFSGYDFPEDLSRYTMAVQCGGCMINRREIDARLKKMEKAGLPMTNYGILLAWCGGILARACAVFGEDAAI